MRKHYKLGLASIILLSIVGSLFVGAYPINWKTILALNEIEKSVLIDIRLLRMCTALLVGGFLATSGAVFQGVLKNSLADPYILGVSSGAAFGASIGVLVGMPITWVPMLCLIGALITIFLVIKIVNVLKSKSILHYVLAGIFVNAFFSSGMMAVYFLAQYNLASIMSWLLGDLGMASWTLFGGALILGGALFLDIYRLSYQLTIYTQGDDASKSVGVSPQKLRTRLLITASLLTAIAVSLAGIVGFIGLITPHLIRLCGIQDFRKVIPLSFISGGCLLSISDTLSRLISDTIQLPIGIVTSLLGVPIFLIILLKSGLFNEQH